MRAHMECTVFENGLKDINGCQIRPIKCLVNLVMHKKGKMEQL